MLLAIVEFAVEVAVSVVFLFVALVEGSRPVPIAAGKSSVVNDPSSFSRSLTTLFNELPLFELASFWTLHVVPDDNPC